MAMIFCFYRTQYQLMMEIEQTLATWKFQWRHLVVKIVTSGSVTLPPDGQNCSECNGVGWDIL